MCTTEFGAATLFLSFLCLKSLFLNKKGLLFFDFFVRLSRTCVQHSGTAVQQCRMSVPHCRTKIPIRISYFFLPTSLYFVAYSSSFSSRQQREKIASQCGKRDSATGAYIGPSCPPRNPDDRLPSSHLAANSRSQQTHGETHGSSRNAPLQHPDPRIP